MGTKLQLGLPMMTLALVIFIRDLHETGRGKQRPTRASASCKIHFPERPVRDLSRDRSKR
jgi:hypothetical protein